MAGPERLRGPARATQHAGSPTAVGARPDRSGDAWATGASFRRSGRGTQCATNASVECEDLRTPKALENPYPRFRLTVYAGHRASDPRMPGVFGDCSFRYARG